MFDFDPAEAWIFGFLGTMGSLALAMGFAALSSGGCLS
jgi:hypothetical protein